jgi:hypothetical protein
MMGSLGQQHWDGVLWPGKLASSAGYQLQANEEDDVGFTKQYHSDASRELESELSPFEQHQQQQGCDVILQPVEAEGRSVDCEHTKDDAGSDASSSRFAGLPR